MSFEQSLETMRLGTSGKEPSQTNLDYYAKPENYEGSNIHTISKFVYTAKKEEEKNKKSDDRDKINGRLKYMFDRYKDICGDDASDTSGHSVHSGDIPHIYKLPHAHTLASMHLNHKHPSKYHSKSNKTNHLRSATTENLNYTSMDNYSPHSNHKPSTPRQIPPSSHNQDDAESVASSSTSPTKVRHESTTNAGVSDAQRKISVLSSTSGPYRSAATSLSNVNAEDLKLAMAKERFRHAIKLVLILLKWISTLTEKEDEEGNITGGKTFTDIASEAFEAGNVKNTAIAFDVSQFKARKEMSISNEVKHILSIPSESRTPEQLQTALFGLQHLKSFAEYPLHMQVKLCKVAWFQQVPHKKVIIRQGHYAENFYFILSGQAVVRILDKNPKTGEVSLRTAAVMRKGTSFGELALLHRSRRTATVVSQDTVQLLSIGREDFLDIFMSRSGGPGEIPDHIQFISGMDFLQGWPIEKLLERPECCLFHFFKRGVVIVKDSNQSEWLYIVKSGSCQVMKRLKGVRPQTTNPKSRGGSMSSREDDTYRKLPKIDNLIPCEPKIDTGRQKKTKNVRIVSPVRRAIEEYNDFMHQQQENSITGDLNTRQEGHTNDENNETSPSKTTTTKSANERSSTSQSNALSDKPGFSKSKFSLFPKPKTNLPYFDMTNEKSNSSTTSSGRQLPRKSHSAKVISKKNEKTVIEEKVIPLEDLGPVFVQVEKLKPRDIFGLSSVHFEETIDDPGTSVSLVSNGAECIMLSKKFFIAHATELTKKIVRHSVHPYPSEESLQHNLQTKVDWDIYKRHLVDDMVSSIQLFRTQDKQTNLPDIKTSAR